jgi:uncharacterized protein Usg
VLQFTYRSPRVDQGKNGVIEKKYEDVFDAVPKVKEFIEGFWQPTREGEMHIISLTASGWALARIADIMVNVPLPKKRPDGYVTWTGDMAAFILLNFPI